MSPLYFRIFFKPGFVCEFICFLFLHIVNNQCLPIVQGVEQFDNFSAAVGKKLLCFETVFPLPNFICNLKNMFIS